MSVLTVAAAKVHLNVTTSTQDAEIQTFIDAAEAAIATRCGPLASTPGITERHAGGGRASLVLRVTPVISIQSVAAVDGATIDVAQLDLRSDTGIVSYLRGQLFPSFASLLYDVTYTAGWDPVPKDLMLAVKELVRHFWEGSQRGPVARPGTDTPSTSGIAGGLPDVVAELIDPYVPVAIA